MTYNQSRLKEKLNELVNQHSELDDAIERINEKIPFDQVKLQRLKKRKLVLKDEINKLKKLAKFLNLNLNLHHIMKLEKN